MDSVGALLIAVLSAILYALGAYVKKTPKEEFSEEKFFVTVLIGIAIGVVSYSMGLTLDSAEQFLVSAGLIVYIEVWGKAVFRRLIPYIRGKLESLFDLLSEVNENAA